MGTESQAPVFGAGMDPGVLSQFHFLGVDGIVRTPDVIAGLKNPFTFSGVVTDNAATPADLTLSAAIADKRLQANYVGGNDNPDMLLYVEAFRVLFVAAAESAAALNLVMRQTYLEHMAGSVSRYVPLNSAADIWPPGLSQGGGDATAGKPITERVYGVQREPVELDDPLLVYFRMDTFQVAISAAVDLGGNLPFTLELFGVAWSPAKGRLGESSAAAKGWSQRQKETAGRSARGLGRHRGTPQSSGR